MAADLVIGVDFGSDSSRAVVINAITGIVVGTGRCDYPRWAEGKYCNSSERRFRQHPLDYLEAFEVCVKGALKQAGEEAGNRILAIGIDTTGSTPCPVNKEGVPLALLPEFAEEPNAMFYLWKDHTAIEEAKEITAVIKDFEGEDYTRFQGTYSSEWFWAKILHASRVDPRVKEAAYSWVEHCDWIPALLTGNTDPNSMYRCSCAAGHKALWHSDFGGLPAKRCLSSIDPYLAQVAGSLGSGPESSVCRVGTITDEWAKRLGIRKKAVIGGSSLDAHAGAVGAGIKPNILVKVVGTSTVDMLVHKREELRGKDLKDCCGQAENSILPDYIGIEAGQAAFGDIYSWFRRVLMWPVDHLVLDSPYLDPAHREAFRQDCYRSLISELEKEALKLEDADDLIVMDWFNGRRYPFINEKVKGGISGLTLGTDAVQIYRAIALATVFGSRRIFDSFISRGLRIDEVIMVGGIAQKSSLVMQMMADVLKRPIKISDTEQACAQGAAMYAAAAAGVYENLLEAQNHMCQGFSHIYKPIENNFAKYDTLYRQYLNFGRHIESMLEEVKGKGDQYDAKNGQNGVKLRE